MTTLGEILPEAVMPEVTELMNMMLRGEITPNDGIIRLMAVLEPHKAELEAKNMASEFLAAWLVSSLPQIAAGAERRPGKEG